MLSFIGMGLYDEKSVTIRGYEAIKEADLVFLERYTSKLFGTTIEDLNRYYNTNIETLRRKDIELEPEKILEFAKRKKVAILIAGDPMVATTHVDLRLRAHDLGIETSIIHGTSVMTAICGLTGLQNYRFGKSTTIPFDSFEKLPPSVCQTIIENQERRLHTLVYLDIDMENDRYMLGEEAASKLVYFDENGIGIVIARAGSQNPSIVTGRFTDLAEKNYGDPLHIMVVPGELHHMEIESLNAFSETLTVLE